MGTQKKSPHRVKNKQGGPINSTDTTDDRCNVEDKTMCTKKKRAVVIEQTTNKLPAWAVNDNNNNNVATRDRETEILANLGIDAIPTNPEEIVTSTEAFAEFVDRIRPKFKRRIKQEEYTKQQQQVTTASSSDFQNGHQHPLPSSISIQAVIELRGLPYWMSESGLNLKLVGKKGLLDAYLIKHGISYLIFDTMLNALEMMFHYKDKLHVWSERME